MRIRKAAPGDVERCVDIEFEIFSYDREGSVYEMNRQVRDEDYIFLVAEEKGKVIGFITAKKHRWNRAVWLERLFVTKKSQRKGIGTKLVDGVKKEARKFKAIQVFVDTGTLYHYQAEFYMKNGFKSVGFIKNFYANEPNPKDRDSQIMAYRL